MKIRMNKMSAHEWASYKADIIAALVAWVLLCAFAWWKMERGDIGPLLKHNPCAPGYEVIIDGERAGCTNDAALNQRWRPTLSNN